MIFEETEKVESLNLTICGVFYTLRLIINSIFNQHSLNKHFNNKSCTSYNKNSVKNPPGGQIEPTLGSPIYMVT